MAVTRKKNKRKMKRLHTRRLANEIWIGFFSGVFSISGNLTEITSELTSTLYFVLLQKRKQYHNYNKKLFTHSTKLATTITPRTPMKSAVSLLYNHCWVEISITKHVYFNLITKHGHFWKISMVFRNFSTE